MTDIIREFNMTDLLGMLVPGSVLAFLFDKEFALINSLETYMNIEFSTGILITILIVVGYFIGMLLHEIGEVVEKLIWFYPGFNPRIYAAFTTNICECTEVNIPNKEPKWWNYMLFASSVLLAGLLIGICFQIFDIKDGLWISICLTFALLVVTYLFMCLTIRQKKRERTFSAIVRQAFQLCSFNTPLSYNVWKSNDKNDEYVRMILRKRDLFDGFRTSARNMLVMFIVVGIYACSSHGLMSSMRSVILNKTEFLWLFSISLVVMLWRYYHFTYLRYKYCYEDYIDQKQHTSSSC